MNKDQADECLQIETDFVCKNNPPSWYGCRKCKYYYNINGSKGEHRWHGMTRKNIMNAIDAENLSVALKHYAKNVMNG